MSQEIEKLPAEEANRILKLPNSYFEKGMKRGIERGIEQGIEQMVCRMLKKDSQRKSLRR
ncbi:hypothetical protein ACI2OX_04230 [Bacillus sp. N9]